MMEQLWYYFNDLCQTVPQCLYYGLLSLLCLGIGILVYCCGLKRTWRIIAALSLVEYVFLVLCSTVFFRTVVDGYGHEFRPFWSYEAIEKGRSELLVENVMNVMVFIPIGILLGVMIYGTKFTVKKTWLIVLIVGIGISLSIEAMQYLFHRGFAETDDVMHNALGSLIGFMIVAIIEGIWSSHKRYSMN